MIIVLTWISYRHNRMHKSVIDRIKRQDRRINEAIYKMSRQPKTDSTRKTNYATPKAGTGRVATHHDVLGEIVCPHCNRKYPASSISCPHCGVEPDHKTYSLDSKRY